MEIDVHRIIGEVAAKHGFALNADDPLIALATVNSIVLQDAVRQAGDEISARIAGFSSTLDALERRAGEALGQQTGKLITEVRDQLKVEIRKTVNVSEQARKVRTCAALIAVVGVVAFVLGILTDRFLR